MIDKNEVSAWFKLLQDDICDQLSRCDGLATFKEDLWNRSGGGGGRTRIIRDGDIFEKGGVNFSEVHGEVTPALQSQLNTEATAFYATGVSIVIHPNHPLVPIIHMNVRYFELNNGIAWFGGGIDLTPHYIDHADAKFFHQQLKTICDQHKNHVDYGKLKKWADDYFFIPHRNETRGVGGIFYDYLGKDNTSDLSSIFNFTKDVGNTFAITYTALVDKNRSLPRDPAHRDWQMLRRGRYVEFNLVHDRGTRFGLVSNGRTESILMSLPNLASWEYDAVPEEGSREMETLELLKKGIDWVG